MARRIWPFGLTILFCSALSLGLFVFSPLGAEENEDLLYLPAVFGESPSEKPIDQGSLQTEDLVINSLAVGTIHRWTMVLLARRHNYGLRRAGQFGRHFTCSLSQRGPGPRTEPESAR